MMKKNRTIYFLLALVCLGLQSCLFQEEDYFDDSSANRATADVKRCSELLEAAPNGWVMEYYVGKDYSLGGITLLCKFDGQRVTMASQIAGADETVSSLYSVKSIPSNNQLLLHASRRSVSGLHDSEKKRLFQSNKGYKESLRF